ncbi:glycosyltransferase [Granulicella sp. 5B5]|uniref:glycosyltransferase n=1 Tax=Granulicella sp. 5B5 TaxID=1617967 RepID=UPI0015F3C206|nr:glycosyltransferase [Granulicella sp. 5B5]
MFATKPRIALVHDWLTGMRGGEKVLAALCQLYPDAPIWTLVYVRGSASPTIARHLIHTSLLQTMPRSGTLYRQYLPLFPLFAELHKADASQLIVSTSHAVAKSMVKRHSGARHICYIHTPMRYAWDLFEEYFGVERHGWFLSRCVYRPILSLIQRYDRATIGRVDLFVANSSFIAERVKRIYHRDAVVLPPPVAIDRFIALERAPEDWYLVVSALVPYKRVADAIHACHHLGRRLKVIGKGPEFDSLSQLANSLGAPIEMLGALDDEALADHYRRAKALLFPGIEDFGIVPLEAIAAGCPVIAYAHGGILDSMTSDTAVFYHQQTTEGLVDGITRFEQKPEAFQTDVMRAHASKFTEQAFIIAFAKIANDLLSQPATGALT